MSTERISREELFALVWEKPTQEVAEELGVSDVAIGKLCTRLQVPKPPRGYWARVKVGQTPKRPPLAAFRDEVDRKRRATEHAKAAGLLSKLQLEFYQAALRELRARGVDLGDAEMTGSRLPNLSPDMAAQILLLIQSSGHIWIKEGRVAAGSSHSVQRSAANLVDKLLPLARPQLLMFESDRKKGGYVANGPAVLVRFTAHLQERVASLVRVIREQELVHVVMPLMSADHAWSAHHVYSPEARLFLDSTLCISSTEIWVECMRRAWREEDPPERISTSRLKLREIMPIDYMAPREIVLSPAVSQASVAPYRERLRGLIEAERVYEMLSSATYAMERQVPGETLRLADRIWFGRERPFGAAREAWARVEDQLASWEADLEAERSALAQSILGVSIGDIVVTEARGRTLRLCITQMTLYGTEKGSTFVMNGTRFRKDGTFGKLQETFSLHFEDETLGL